jgi:hypothetical protein
MKSAKFRFFPLYEGLVLVVFSLVGCNSGQQYALRATDTSNALEGEVSVSEDNLGNTTLDIDVKNLDGQSTPEAPKYYVAWAKNKSDTVRLGLLNVDDRNGELIATTELDRFTVMITSEKSPEVSQPSDRTRLESQMIVVE